MMKGYSFWDVWFHEVYLLYLCILVIVILIDYRMIKSDNNNSSDAPIFSKAIGAFFS